MTLMVEWLKSTTVVGTGHRDEHGEPARWWKKSWVVALLLFFLTACYFWRIAFTDQYTWLNSPDLTAQVIPWFQLQVGEIQRGRLPLWDPYMFAGQPLIGQLQPGAAYPLNWLLFLLPTRHGWIRMEHLNWYYIAIHFLALAFTYWLCRDVGLSRLASTGGGMIYAFGSYMGHIDWPQMINGAVWGPLILMFLLRVGRGERVWANAAKGGLALGVCFLSGHHQVPIYFTLMAAGVWVWILFRHGVPARRMLAAAMLFFVLMGLAGALQTLPAWEYSRNAVRWVGAPDPVGHADKVPYSIHSHYSLKTHNTVGLGILHGESGHNTGLVAMLLLVLGVAAGWDRVAVRVATGVAVGGLLYSFGGGTLLHGILYSLLPMVDKARSPAMAMCVLQIGIAVLAAHGLDRLAQSREWLVRLQKSSLALGAAILAVWYVWDVFGRSSQSSGDPRATLNAVAALLASAIFAGLAREAIGARTAMLCLGGLMLMELGEGSVAYLPHKTGGFPQVDMIAKSGDLMQAIRDLGPEHRAEIEEFPYSVSSYHGIETWNGHIASLTSNTHLLSQNDRGLALLGVRYMLGKGKRGIWTEQIGAVGERALLRAPSAFPRTWIVHEAVEVKTRQGVIEMLNDNKWDLRQKAGVRGAPPKLETCSGKEESWLLRRDSNRVDVWAELDCRGMVILSDTWYPGWKATVDGRDAEIVEAYGAVRGVVVEKGRHRIEMRYRPWSVYLGFLATLSAVALGIFVCRVDAQKAGRD